MPLPRGMHVEHMMPLGDVLAQFPSRPQLQRSLLKGIARRHPDVFAELVALANETGATDAVATHV